METKFLKLTIWFVAIAIILLAIFYFSISNNGRIFSSERKILKEEANQLKIDNQKNIEQASQKKLTSVRPIDKTDHINGNLNAPVELILYYDYECPFSASFNRDIKRIKDEFGNKIVMAFRHFPLVSHKRAIMTGLAVECAAEQGQFTAMQDQLFANNKENSNELDKIINDAEALGMDRGKFETCMAEERYTDKVVQQKKEAEGFGVVGTPTSFLNNMILPGSYKIEDYTDSTGKVHLGLKSLIRAELQ